MIKVMIDTVWMRCIFVEPWVPGRCIATLEIKLSQRAGTCKVVVNNVEKYCDSILMTFINELLVHFTRSVILIKSKI